MPSLVADTVVSVRFISESAGVTVARAGLPYFRNSWCGLRRLGSDPSAQCTYTTVDVTAVRLILFIHAHVTVGPTAPPSPAGSDSVFVDGTGLWDEIQIASFRLMGNWRPKAG